MVNQASPRKLLPLTVAWVVMAALWTYGVRAESAPVPAQAGGARWLHKNAPGILTLSGTAGASLAVDGVSKGELPVEPLTLKAGPHTVALKKEGFAPALRKFTLHPDEKARISLELEPLHGTGQLELPSDRELPPLVAAGVPLPNIASDEDGPGGTLKGLRTGPPIPVGQAPTLSPALAPAALPAPATSRAPVAEAPLLVVGGELVRADAAPKPAAPIGVRPAPARALAAPPEAVVAGTIQTQPITKKWWFWGGLGAAAVVVVAGVIYALPPNYSETRDPTAGCGGTCGVVVNK